ncbi:MAG TPA: UDP-3-O-(3-hydroxymyristoyl)glucosamine N-acyltransferase [Mesotoga sp.]|nr:UDP-3-O-(3-hydroxymyristoyl)glucosamine N-acyltransferase [Mesotoga sp.]
MRLIELSNQVNWVTVEKDGEFEALGKLNALTSEHTLVFLNDEKYIAQIGNSMVSAVITNEKIASTLKELDVGILVTDNPKRDFYRIHDHLIDSGFYFETFETLIDESAVISPKAYIAPKNVRIGKNTVIYPNAVILENSLIGDNCVIMSGTIVGSEGYEVVDIEGHNQIVRHAGWAVLKNDVQIEANTVVCKGLFPTRNTILHEEVTIDNLVHVAHGVEIGKKSKIVALAMLGGNTRIGENVWIGPSAVITSGISIGDEAAVTLGSVVTRNVPAGKRVSGNFAIDHERFIQFLKSIR